MSRNGHQQQVEYAIFNPLAAYRYVQSLVSAYARSPAPVRVALLSRCSRDFSLSTLGGVCILLYHVLLLKAHETQQRLTYRTAFECLNTALDFFDLAGTLNLHETRRVRIAIDSLFPISLKTIDHIPSRLLLRLAEFSEQLSQREQQLSRSSVLTMRVATFGQKVSEARVEENQTVDVPKAPTFDS